MSIILNEYKWAESALSEMSLGKKPTETLGRIAKYYMYNGNTKAESREMLDAFLLSCEPNTSVTGWSDTLDRIVKNAEKYPLIVIDSVPVTKKEMECIQKVPGMQLQRLAFTLLCVAKYKKMTSEKNDYWVNTPDRDIMKMANIKTSVKRQSIMFGQLKDLGLIRFSKKVDNTSVQVLFAQDGETAIEVSDFRNLGYQYMNYFGGQYFICECCGIMDKYNDDDRGRRRKYCESCSVKIRIKQSVDSVMRKRNTAKLQIV